MHFKCTQTEIRIIHNHTLILTIWNAFLFYVKAILAVGCYMLEFFLLYLSKYLGEMHDLSTKWKQHETALM